MRIGLLQQWAHIRVLNLSDLREPKSVQLPKNQCIRKRQRGGLHSISRRNVLKCEQALARSAITALRVGAASRFGSQLQCMARLEGQERLRCPQRCIPVHQVR